jgi:hypothetical protein
MPRFRTQPYVTAPEPTRSSSDNTRKAFLDTKGIQMMPQGQYFDTYRLDSTGVTMKVNHSVKQKLGFSDVQSFTPATAAIARAVSATVGPEDCDQ